MIMTVHPVATPIIWLAFALLTVTGTLNSLIGYQVGKQGLGAIQKRFPNLGARQLDQARVLCTRRGPGVLVLSGAPVLGGILALTAGLLHTELRTFLPWVALGKLARNVVLLALMEVGFLSLRK
jgi:membrane protein YqaA with SNARE-associated domain